jgi:hypothetical protein
VPGSSVCAGAGVLETALEVAFAEVDVGNDVVTEIAEVANDGVREGLEALANVDDGAEDVEIASVESGAELLLAVDVVDATGAEDNTAELDCSVAKELDVTTEDALLAHVDDCASDKAPNARLTIR